jgi:hypothetical protein
MIVEMSDEKKSEAGFKQATFTKGQEGDKIFFPGVS